MDPRIPALPASAAVDDGDDPFGWLEDVDSDAALDWVRARNADSEAALVAHPDHAALQAELLEVLDARDRIPAIVRRGPFFYNLWQDEQHRRGLWRRTTLDEYRRAEPAWETVLDIDALAAAEGENWVWAGATTLAPEHRRCLVSLSRGGADATVVREFDCVDKVFVGDGFVLPEAKSDVEWIDADQIFVGSDFGPGSLTDSGYPRFTKRWRRGTPLADASTVFEGRTQDVSVRAAVDDTPGFERSFFIRSRDFFHREVFLLGADGSLQPLAVPDDSSFGLLRDSLMLTLRSELRCGEQIFAAGSLLAIDLQRFQHGARDFQVLFMPTPSCALADHTTTRDHLIVNLNDQVTSRLQAWRKVGSVFEQVAIDSPANGSLAVAGLHDPHDDRDPLANHYLLSHSGFLDPDTLWLGDAAAASGIPREQLKARQPLFDAGGKRVEQRFATSKDGTRIPFFIVWPTDVPTGPLPTALYGYGGFEISLTPAYAAGVGRGWLDRGGVWVVANIRGGGEFGPGWHRSAQKANKQRSYDDFIAVAEALIAAGITTPRQLGIIGGSNGGLLVGATMVQRPELFNAVVIKVPLLDMRRFHRLLAGASWIAEYGNPDDPEDWAVISTYSPYQNVRAGVRYPKVLFTTSARDDRVHPGHARKMAERMLAQGHSLLYYENIEGGHGGAADNAQRARLQAMEYGFLWQQLGG
ncbi:prolyl oligopeptidase family serine peptidase [Piscinibacter sakaiensis]|uniref:prolyl oligopeptidase family serine peptidase n=1 Tax=Piscinibacter sakaiensis TaxID=1547922 RepID=UPI003AAD2FAF